MKVLNLGCGKKKMNEPGVVNCDVTSRTSPDIVWDLNQTPWPWKDNEFNFVVCHDVLEHLLNVVKALEEIYRVLNEGGCVTIRVPLWGVEQSYRDITHLHWFTLDSFDYFDPSKKMCQEYGFYTDARFKILKKHIDGSGIVFDLQKL